MTNTILWKIMKMHMTVMMCRIEFLTSSMYSWLHVVFREQLTQIAIRDPFFISYSSPEFYGSHPPSNPLSGTSSAVKEACTPKNTSSV